MQKTFILKEDSNGNFNQADLDSLLADGWREIRTTPMGGKNPVILVILQKDPYVREYFAGKYGLDYVDENGKIVRAERHPDHKDYI